MDTTAPDPDPRRERGRWMGVILALPLLVFGGGWLWRYLEVRVLTAPRPEMVVITPGSVVLGSPAEEPGRDADEPRRAVRLTRAFALGRTEVTRAQWRAVMGTDPAYFQGDYSGGPDHPVERVSWYDAVAYLNTLSKSEGLPACYLLEGCVGAPGGGCAAVADFCREGYRCAVRFAGLDCAGYRLPTEAEWAYAARAGGAAPALAPRSANDAPRLDPLAWYGGNSGVEAGIPCYFWPGRVAEARECGTHPVALKAPNAWGLYDMLGNVWEWVHDGYAERPPAGVDPVGPEDADLRVRRGGGISSPALKLRLANRGHAPADLRKHVIGFRPARTLSPTPAHPGL